MLKNNKLVSIIAGTLLISCATTVGYFSWPQHKQTPKVDYNTGQTVKLKPNAQDQANSIVIRFAKIEDIPALLDLRQHLVHTFFKPQIINPASIGLKSKDEPNQYAIKTPAFFANIKDGGFEYNVDFYKKTFPMAIAQKNGWGLLIALNSQNQPVGMLLYNIKNYPTEMSRHSNDTAEIKYFIMHESMRGKGAGKALITAVLKHCYQTHPHIKRWELETTRYHNADTIAFYEKIGFTLVTPEPSIVAQEHLLYELTPEKYRELIKT